MSTTETHLSTLAALRNRLSAASSCGAVTGEGNFNFILATYNNILNDVENKRLKAEAEVIRLEKQVAAANAEAEGCRTLRTIVYNVVDKFASLAEAEVKQKEALEELRNNPPEDDSDDEDDSEDEDEDEGLSEDEKEKIALDALKKRQAEESSLKASISKATKQVKKKRR